MKIRLVSASLLTGALVAGLVSAQTMKPPMKGGMKVNAMDAKALKDMCQVNMAEIAAGKLAQKNGTPKAKMFGEKMIADHTKAHNELKMLAKEKGVMLPMEPKPADKQTAMKLMKLKGSEFDKAYFMAQTKGHQMAYAMATKAAKDCKDPQVKAYFAKYAPIIGEHLKMAKMDGMGHMEKMSPAPKPPAPMAKGMPK